MNNEASQHTIARLPVWLHFIGVITFIGTAGLTARLIWEQTVWTWERGPQMVGFSLVHGAWAPVILFPPCLILWTIVVTALTLWSLAKKRPVARLRWVELGIVVLLFAVMFLPENFWQRVFVGKMASSPHAADLLVRSIYRGDFRTARAMLSRGVSVNGADPFYWTTPLHAAAAVGDLQMIRDLLARGASVNALDRNGDSPLELASSGGNREAAALLATRGGKRMRGDETQRQKASHDKATQVIEQDRRSTIAQVTGVWHTRKGWGTGQRSITADVAHVNGYLTGTIVITKSNGTPLTLPMVNLSASGNDLFFLTRDDGGLSQWQLTIVSDRRARLRGQVREMRIDEQVEKQ